MLLFSETRSLQVIRYSFDVASELCIVQGFDHIKERGEKSKSLPAWLNLTLSQCFLSFLYKVALHPGRWT